MCTAHTHLNTTVLDTRLLFLPWTVNKSQIVYDEDTRRQTQRVAELCTFNYTHKHETLAKEQSINLLFIRLQRLNTSKCDPLAYITVNMKAQDKSVGRRIEPLIRLMRKTSVSLHITVSFFFFFNFSLCCLWPLLLTLFVNLFIFHSLSFHFPLFSILSRSGTTVPVLATVHIAPPIMLHQSKYSKSDKVGKNKCLFAVQVSSIMDHH